ncbi:hypothetical protein BDV59DRAFT_173086 [Aspergillus ambiguus]|uniref:ankyrin repeat protein n=1 Tax=Aspergillus ambiguus TaxID=176160 RepID=UPI003CCD2D81
MAWVEALLTKNFIEEGAHDVESFKGLEKSFRYQHRGQRTHSHFMRPLCQSSPRVPRPGLRQEDSYGDKSEEEKTPQIVVNHNHHGSNQVPPRGTEDPPKSKKQKNQGTKFERVDSYSQDDGGNSSQGKKTKGPTKKGKGPTNAIKARQDDKQRAPLSLSLCRDQPSCNVYMFMPYLHFETAERREKMQEAIQRAEMLNAPPQPGITRSPTRDEMLLRAHLASSTTSLHVRRTLDQFFYPNIDTQTRDRDQVVYRYQTKGQGRGRYATEPKIFMVDQLWMWIMGTNLIVTSFAQRWEQPKNDPLNVLDGIIEDINSKTREPVRSVYDLAIIITNRCSGVFDRHRMGDEEYQFLDMFEASIGIATDRETMLFNRFNRASAQASDWLKNHRKLSRFKQDTPADDSKGGPQFMMLQEDTTVAAAAADEEPLFVDNLLDIGQETDLLSEAKDIRDELGMIRTVLEHQQNVLDDFYGAICEIYHGQQRSQYEVKKRFKEQQRTIDMHLKDISRMDHQAERIYSSITDLLDLKQKHANAFEARFARDQAAGTTRQGKIILVFTLVTIIFLPLSFITSIFTINIAEFPHDSNGNESLHLAYVAKYVFGVGFAISIPLIVLALSVDDIGDVCAEGVRRVRCWLSRTRSSTTMSRRTPEMERPVTARDMEKILSGRRSYESDFPSVLPVSTRDTGRSKRKNVFAREGFS